MTAIFRYVIRCWHSARADVAMEHLDEAQARWEREKREKIK